MAGRGRGGCRARGHRARRDPPRASGAGVARDRPVVARVADVAGAPSPRSHAPVTEPGVGEELLRLEGLEVHFPIRGGLFDSLPPTPDAVVRAVDGIDLTIRKGEILGLVGESGSGKTTTGRVIVKLTKQTGGRIVFDGQDVSTLWGTKALRAYRRRVQLIFQDPYETLNPKHTIGEFVAEPLIVNNIGASRAERRRPGRRRARVRRPAPGGGVRGPLPARALRRPAAARGDRGRAGDGPGADRRRRAGLDARRLDPHRAPAPDARPAQGARAHLPVHHPRPVAGLGAGRPDRRDVPRPDHGDRPRRAGHPVAAQPVHAGAGVGEPVTGPARGRRTGQAGRSSSARRRTRSTSRPAAGSTRAARSRSTGAAPRSRR